MTYKALEQEAGAREKIDREIRVETIRTSPLCMYLFDPDREKKAQGKSTRTIKEYIEKWVETGFIEEPAFTVALTYEQLLLGLVQELMILARESERIRQEAVDELNTLKARIRFYDPDAGRSLIDTEEESDVTGTGGTTDADGAD
jgi:hypothetical protein